MNPRRPSPGSFWAKHCPEAYPREWLDGARQLPDGFTRPAGSLEADLITGRIPEVEFLRRSGKAGPPSPSPSTRGKGKGKTPPVVKKLFGLNRFLDGLLDREPKLQPLAVAIWCWLWRCEKNGRARTSERKLAERFGVCRDNLRARLNELLDAGFLIVVRRGVRGRSATVYRIQPVPRKLTSKAKVNREIVDDKSDR